MRKLLTFSRRLAFVALSAWIWQAATETLRCELPPPGAQPTTPAEQWLTAKVLSGTIANLEGCSDRTVRAEFLETLVTSTTLPAIVQKNGIHIYNANVVGNLNIVNQEVPNELWLMQCTFNHDVAFSRTSFKKGLAFNQSTFLGAARFDGIKVAGMAFFQHSIFKGPVTFSHAVIAD